MIVVLSDSSKPESDTIHCLCDDCGRNFAGTWLHGLCKYKRARQIGAMVKSNGKLRCNRCVEIHRRERLSDPPVEDD